MIRKFKKEKTKLSPQAAKYLHMALNVALSEVIMRAGHQAYAEGTAVVTVDILQKVLPQLVSIKSFNLSPARKCK